MLLDELLKGVDYRGAVPDADISDVTADSRRAGKGMLFVCLSGGKFDGHDYAADAAGKGCLAVVAERQTDAPLPHIIVKNSRLAYSLICANFFGCPSKAMKLVGVTGTKGKTTTTMLIKHIMEAGGCKTGLIGTIQNMSGGRVLPSNYTTPEPYELQRLFRTMADDGCEYVVMEVSSIALAQDRVAGCRFEAAVFTNFSQDHLDYHGTMENYLAAKQKIFRQSECGIVNLDDPAADKIISESPCKTVTFSTNRMDADFTARNIKYRADGSDYDVVGLGVIGRVKISLPGGFNVYNSLGAVSCAVTLGISLKAAIDALHSAKSVKGRVEVVPTGRDFTLILDYAHSPGSLEQILKTLNAFKKGRLVVLFGCGGDRDKSKRPIMGKIAADHSDFVIVTSDNPRTEEPSKIIEDILGGLKDTETPHVTIENRREAIRFAIENAQKDDIVLLAGKGHEDYQILGTTKIHFDEREVVADILKETDSK